MKNDKVMKNAELAERISLETGVDIKTCEKVINSFEEQVIKALTEGKAVHLFRFGKFQLTYIKEHETFSPFTKERFRKEACYSPRFKPSDNLFIRINEAFFPERYKRAKAGGNVYGK